MTQRDLRFQNIFGYNKTPFLMTEYIIRFTCNDFVMKVFVVAFSNFMRKLIYLWNFK